MRLPFALPFIICFAAIALIRYLNTDSPGRTAGPHQPLHFPSSLASMAKVAVVGSTGSTGQAVVHSLSSHPSIASITAITRRAFFSSPAPTLHERVIPNLTEIQPADFDSASAVFCCLGTTRAQAGGAEQFKQQDRDLIILVARRAREAGVSSFQLVSSGGADANSSFLYMQCKGQIEQEVTALGFPQLAIWRPGFLDTSKYPRQQSRGVEAVLGPVMSVLGGLLGKYRSTKVENVADAMIKDALSDRKGLKIYEGTPEILRFLRDNATSTPPPSAPASAAAGSSEPAA